MCHNIANGIKPDSTSKTTDKHAVDYSKACMLGRKVIYVRCLNCSHKVSVSLIKKQFLFIQEQFHGSKSF